MKYTNLFLLSIFVLALVPSVSALRGVGLEYGTTGQIVPDDIETCIPYGVYNPWDEDVYIKLSSTGQLADFSISSETKFVPAKTFHNDSVSMAICFKIPRVYEKDCIALLACKRTCPEERVEYDGLIIATEDRKMSEIKGTGSATSVSASAPLKLVISCEDKPRNWIPLIAVIAAIAVVIIALIRIKMIMKKPWQKRTK